VGGWLTIWCEFLGPDWIFDEEILAAGYAILHIPHQVLRDYYRITVQWFSLQFDGITAMAGSPVNPSLANSAAGVTKSFHGSFYHSLAPNPNFLKSLRSNAYTMFLMYIF